MRYINLRLTYLLAYLLAVCRQNQHLTVCRERRLNKYNL